MAQGYQFIQSQTLTGNASSVTFSNIPQNYTDLYLKINARSSSTTGLSRAIRMQINGDTTYSNYRQRYIAISDTNTATAGAFTSSTGLQYYLYGLPTANSTTYSFGATDINFINYSGSSYKTISSESFTEGFANPFSSGTAAAGLTAMLWVNTAAITSLVFTPDDSSNFASGSSFTLYGIGGTKASGGTITSDSQYTYHTFTSSGSFTTFEKIKNAEILAIGGGGGGGYNVGGGGGAGGIIWVSGQTLNAGTSYSAIIGAGGNAGGSSSAGSTGSNSYFSSFSAFGGGGGGTRTGSSGGAVPTNGGSGGGSMGDNTSSNIGATATQTGGTNIYAYYGNAGGNGFDYSVSIFAGGGGGGSGTAGEHAKNQGNASAQGGNGGQGTTALGQWLSATNTGVNGSIAAGGGGGGAHNGGTYDNKGIGGLGGGGNGGSNTSAVTSTAGTANTGSGGGGGSNSTWVAGAAGGSGLVIVRYPNYI